MCWEISTRQGKNLELLLFLIERHTFTESEKRFTNLIFSPQVVECTVWNLFYSALIQLCFIN